MMEQDPVEGVLLLRLINPNWDQGGSPSSQAFRPMGDDSTVSFYDGTKITPMGAFDHFTGELGNEAIYVVSIPVKVFLEEGLIIDFNGVPYPSHVNVDYSKIKSKNGRIKVSKRIKAHCKVAYRP